jgi:hypothetical protein
MKSTSKQSESLGYPNLESLLEQPNPDLSAMKEHQATLDSLSKTAKQAKDKGAAKQASLAYTRFFELFEKLLNVRSKLAKK